MLPKSSAADSRANQVLRSLPIHPSHQDPEKLTSTISSISQHRLNNLPRRDSINFRLPSIASILSSPLPKMLLREHQHVDPLVNRSPSECQIDTLLSSTLPQLLVRQYHLDPEAARILTFEFQKHLPIFESLGISIVKLIDFHRSIDLPLFLKFPDAVVYVAPIIKRAITPFPGSPAQFEVAYLASISKALGFWDFGFLIEDLSHFFSISIDHFFLHFL